MVPDPKVCLVNRPSQIHLQSAQTLHFLSPALSFAHLPLCKQSHVWERRIIFLSLALAMTRGFNRVFGERQQKWYSNVLRVHISQFRSDLRPWGSAKPSQTQWQTAVINWPVLFFFLLKRKTFSGTVKTVPLIALPDRTGNLFRRFEIVSGRSGLYLWQSCQHGNRDFLFLASVNPAWWLRVNFASECEESPIIFWIFLKMKE